MQQVHFVMEWGLFSFCDWNFVSSHSSAISIFFFSSSPVTGIHKSEFLLCSKETLYVTAKNLPWILKIMTKQRVQPPSVHFQYSDIMIFIVCHNRHHKVFCFSCHKIVTMECVCSCDQKPYLHNETKGGICIKIEFNPQKNISLLQHGRRFFVYSSNMAAVTSCEHPL